PAELTIRKGDTVVFENRDMVVHDITELPDKTWSSSALSPGRSYKLAIRTSADYFCSIHPVMKGKIVCNKTSKPVAKFSINISPKCRGEFWIYLTENLLSRLLINAMISCCSFPEILRLSKGR